MATDPISVPLKLGDHFVPGIWQYLLPKNLLKITIPRESRATCMNCPRIVTDAYRKDYRCCTYHPRMPNFLIGLALTHDEHAAKIVKSLLKDGFLIPEGFVTPPHKWAQYVSDVEEERFGRSKDVLCPFLNKKNGYCGAYAFRNSVCSTFFCLHDHGSKGEGFWDALQTLAAQCELALGQWVMDELGVDVDDYFERMNHLATKIKTVSAGKNKGWSEKALKVLWGPLRGKELEFFEKCAEKVSSERDRLWEIANATDILESVAFDKASIKVVDKKHRKKCQEELGEEGDTVAPHSLWKDLLKQHNKLYSIPGGPLTLNKRVKISANPKKSPEEKYYESKDFVVSFFEDKRAEEPEWREFVSQNEVDLLNQFESPQLMNIQTIQKVSQHCSDDPLAVISHWVQKKVIQPAKS